MPIADGLTSTKLIRSFEKANPDQPLSTRASKNGRIPIIAVSASLVERERQNYIDAGFDAWILKPISFPRLNELMKGIINPKVREECLYKPGAWEKGGWFERAERSGKTAGGINNGNRKVSASVVVDRRSEADTKPSDSHLPPSGASKDTRVAAATDGPLDDGTEGRIPDEQTRLLKNQEKMNKGEDTSLGDGKKDVQKEAEKDPDKDVVAGNVVSVVDDVKAT